jgi:serine/threonine protein phosphatase PrpC
MSERHLPENVAKNQPGAEQTVSHKPVLTLRLDTPELQAQLEAALQPRTLAEKAQYVLRRVLPRPASSPQAEQTDPYASAHPPDYGRILGGNTKDPSHRQRLSPDIPFLQQAEAPQQRTSSEVQKNPFPQETKAKHYEAVGASLPSDEHPQENQDKFMVVPDKRLVGIFDGMGAYTGGERAARIARDQIGQRLLQLHQEQQNPTAAQVEQTFREGFSLANVQMGLEVTQHRSLKDMGTVAVIAQLVREAGKEKVVYAQAGDARLYVVKKDGALIRLTQDEGGIPSDVAERIDQATSKTDVQGIEHFWNMRNLVKNTLDAKHANPTIRTYELQPDDLMLLATSDGIHDNLTPQEMQGTFKQLLSQNSNLAEIPKALITEAQQRARSSHFRAKPDDMTAVVMKLQ